VGDGKEEGRGEIISPIIILINAESDAKVNPTVIVEISGFSRTATSKQNQHDSESKPHIYALHVRHRIAACVSTPPLR
jgi:hypothetical protein